ncbi:MAG: hypothetical protein ACYDGO_01695 [Smithellaceae bacterium]
MYVSYRGIQTLSMPCNCGSNAHEAEPKTRPFGLKQFGCLMLHNALTHNVAVLIFALCMP